ncbi:MAG: flagellar hook-length control protein FliK [Deltaproteobacteria bacterium]|jgi:hypothetical protein|nr:flagellar hook-length control protein FliK [Deltaproteobacteria bacterium]
MNALAITAATIEYREINLTQDNLIESFKDTDFGAYLESAKEARAKLTKAERIEADLAQVASQKEEAAKEEAKKFGVKRKKLTVKKYEIFEAQAILPQNVQTQISQALMGGSQVEQGARGWELSGHERPSKILAGLLENVKGQGGLWTLNRDNLPALGRVLLASGADSTKVSATLAKLAQGSLTLDKVAKEVNLVEGDLAMAEALGLSGGAETGELSSELASFFTQNAVKGQTLTVTEAGLGAMGQFFLSLGLSAETVKAATVNLKPGETFSSQSLRTLLAGLEEPLAPLLNDGETSELFLALKFMGANNDSLTLFSQYVAQTPTANLDDLLGFLTILEKPGTQTIGSANLAQDVQSLIAGSTIEAEIAKAPVFNEIILKLASLGDRELAGDFTELSPALQALRGGISGLTNGGESYGDQSRGQGKDQEKERLAYSEVNSLTLNQGLEGSGFNQSLAAELGGYGARASLAKRLEQKLLYSVRQGVHRLKMDLEPEALGRLDVELKVKDDKLTAHIRAETAEAYAALEKEISSLKASLLESGLDMNLTLSFSGQEEKDRHFSRAEKNALKAETNANSELASQNAATSIVGQDRLLDKVI